VCMGFLLDIRISGKGERTSAEEDKELMGGWQLCGDMRELSLLVRAGDS